MLAVKPTRLIGAATKECVMSEFFKKVISHAEFKRGMSHLLVGAAIGVVASLIESRRAAD